MDGTILDTYLGIRKSVIEALEQVYPGRIDHGTVEFQVGPRIREIMKAILGEIPEPEMASLEKAFRYSYDICGWESYRVYPHVVETIGKIYNAGTHILYIVTNKPLLPTRNILNKMGIGNMFKDVICSDSVVPKLPDKAAYLEYLCEEKNLEPSNCVYVGDTIEDYHAAAKNKMRFIGVSYGYGKIACDVRFTIIDQFDSLVGLIG